MIGVAPTKNTSLYEQEQTASGNKTGVFAYNLLMAARPLTMTLVALMYFGVKETWEL